MIARILLNTPPLAVVAFYALVFALIRTPESATPPEFLRDAVDATLEWIFWILAVLWAFALFSVAHPAIQMGRGLIGRAFFVATLLLFVVAIATQTEVGLSNSERGPLAFTLTVVTGWFAFISMFFAASALDTFEGHSGWPLKPSNVLTIFAMLFLPVGIWFLSGRVQRLLVKTA